MEGLSKKIKEGIINTILSHKKAEKIVIFGSRAGKDFKKNSDIDIAVFGKNWTDKDINIVKFNLEEGLKTPLKFDVLNFYCLNKETLKKEILKDGRVIYEEKD